MGRGKQTDWRKRRFAQALEAAGVQHVARPYDLRHSFASLLLAEGHTVHYVARQLGHSPSMTLDVYGHVIDELEGRDRIDAEAEIRAARESVVPRSYLSG
jgi:integrase